MQDLVEQHWWVRQRLEAQLLARGARRLRQDPLVLGAVREHDAVRNGLGRAPGRRATPPNTVLLCSLGHGLDALHEGVGLVDRHVVVAQVELLHEPLCAELALVAVGHGRARVSVRDGARGAVPCFATAPRTGTHLSLQWG